MILNGNVKRLAIYFFYDKEGVVDSFVPYFLDDLKKNCSEIFIVCNGKIEADGKRKLEKIGPVFVRENVGFDVWAYKTALEQYGWEKLKTYDEIILLNSTIMGPVYPLKETFDKMNEKDLDFWGITEFFEFPSDPSGCCLYKYIPDHIQSHFIACRKTLVSSEEFQKYWDEMPMINNYWEAVGKHEMIFTKYFSDMGFKWDLSVEMEDLREYNGYPLMMCPTKLIAERRCPIFKRRSFFHDPKDYMSNTAGEQVSKLYDYIKERTDYNVDYIWETILRNYNQADIVKNMNLTYILSRDSSDISDDEIKKYKVAAVMHLYFEDLLEESRKYAEAMPFTTDFYITTDTEEKKKRILKEFESLDCAHLEVRVIENRGRDVSSLLVGVKDVIMQYDIVCFMHDKKTAQIIPGTVGAGFANKCLDNILASSNYVKNVIKCFEQNPRLGLLTPPEPNHGSFFPTIGQEWRNNFKETKELAEKIGIRVPIEENKRPIAPLGTMFWFRPKAMKCLYDKNWTYDDFPPEPNRIDGTKLHAIERLYPFAVQQEGFYPAIVMNDQWAAIEYNNLRYYVRGYNRVLFEHNIESYYENMLNEMEIWMNSSVGHVSWKKFTKRKIKEKIKNILPQKIYFMMKKMVKKEK